MCFNILHLLQRLNPKNTNLTYVLRLYLHSFSENINNIDFIKIVLFLHLCASVSWQTAPGRSVMKCNHQSRMSMLCLSPGAKPIFHQKRMPLWFRCLWSDVIYGIDLGLPTAYWSSLRLCILILSNVPKWSPVSHLGLVNEDCKLSLWFLRSGVLQRYRGK